MSSNHVAGHVRHEKVSRVDEGSLATRILAATAAAVVFADRDGIVRVWNAGAEQLLGYPAGHAIGRRIDLIVPPEYRELHWAGFDRAIATGRPQEPRRRHHPARDTPLR